MNMDGTFRILSYQEEMALSQSDFLEYNCKLQEWVELQRTDVEPDYLEKTHEAKVKYWAEYGRAMRWQVESGLDPYSIFSKQWYDDLVRFEPNLNALVQEAFEVYLKGDWSYQEYLRRVSD